MRRVLNMWLSRAEFAEGDLLFHDRIRLNATASELETLKKFVRGITTLRTAAPILKKMIKTTEIDGTMSLELFDFIVKNKIGIIFIVGFLYLYRLGRNRREDDGIPPSSAILLVILCWGVPGFQNFVKQNEAIIENSPLVKSIIEFERMLNSVCDQAIDQIVDIGSTFIKILIDYSLRLAVWIALFIVPEKALKPCAFIMCCIFSYLFYKIFRDWMRLKKAEYEILVGNSRAHEFNPDKREYRANPDPQQCDAEYPEIGLKKKRKRGKNRKEREW